MAQYIALLRGINVGGKKIIKMADLRLLLSDAGFMAVKTYIQSGNVIFETDINKAEIGAVIGGLIEKSFGFLPRIFILDLAAISLIAFCSKLIRLYLTAGHTAGDTPASSNYLQILTN
ncbi:MAG: DUF1697 domain-containing protein, partial [Rhizobiales bacterium]|nr:DUF1697 domain-containing protein [Hyphomicrobiales bacterium]